MHLLGSAWMDAASSISHHMHAPNPINLPEGRVQSRKLVNACIGAGRSAVVTVTTPISTIRNNMPRSRSAGTREIRSGTLIGNCGSIDQSSRTTTVIGSGTARCYIRVFHVIKIVQCKYATMYRITSP